MRVWPEAYIQRDNTMILLRWGRQSSPTGTSLDSDVTFELGPALRQRQECFAPWRPPIEVFETERELIVRAEIGGLSGDAVAVLVEGDTMVIRGERNVGPARSQRLYHESRVRYGPFEASVRLPFPVNVSTARAEYIDGFLTATLPRLAATKVELRAVERPGGARQEGQ